MDMTPYIGASHTDQNYKNIKFSKSDFANATLTIDLRISDSTNGLSPEVQEERASPLSFKQINAELESEI